MLRRNWLRHGLTSIVLATGLALSGCVQTPDAYSGSLKSSTEWVATSDEWRTKVEAVFAEATSYAENIAATREAGSWAVILDVDETVLNNVAYQIELDRSNTSYTSETWYAWTQKKAATAVPGAIGFIERTNSLGGHVALVTNRSDREQFATEANLRAVGLSRHNDFRVLLTRARPLGPSDKSARFALVPQMLASQGYPNVRVVAYIGDNVGDKPKATGEWRFFCIDQGGMYGEPCVTDTVSAE